VDSPLSPDPEGLAAYELGHRLNEFYFFVIQSFLRNPRNRSSPKAKQKPKPEEDAWAQALGQTERFATRNRGRLQRCISAYCKEWLNYLRSEEYAEDWHCTIDEYRAEGTPLSHSPERSRDEFCHDWTRSAEVEFDYFLDGIGRCLSKPHFHLLRLGVQVDRGIRPRCVWRGMGEQQPTDTAQIATTEAVDPQSAPVEAVDPATGLRNLGRPCVRYCPSGSIEPDVGWRDELNELLKNSPYEQIRSISLDDAVGKVAVEQVDADIREALTSEMKPRWNPTTRKLYYRGKIEKNWKRAPAPNQRQLVEAFSRAGWIRKIENPLDDPDKLPETVANFNREAKGIRFAVSDSGKSVTWEPRSPPAGS